jgi:hypothetical protein
MLKAVILICSSALLPAECQRPNARLVVSVPEYQALPLACIQRGQEAFAQSSLPLAPGEYVKITCEHVL